MKLAKILLFFIFLFIISGQAFASPLKVDSSASTPAGNFYIYSSDTNEISEVNNIESIIDNKADLNNLPTIPGWIISGINDGYLQNRQERTCPFCWIFAIGFAVWLLAYGVWLAIKRPQGNWFRLPLIVGVFIYFTHGALHVMLADPIFLYYYWMILFDELIFAFILFWLIIGPKIHLGHHQIRT